MDNKHKIVPVTRNKRDLKFAAKDNLAQTEKRDQIPGNGGQLGDTPQDPEFIKYGSPQVRRGRARSRTIGSLAINQDNTIADNSAFSLGKHEPFFSPSKPDLAACCQNFAAFLADAAARSKTNGKNPVPSAGFIYGYLRSLFSILHLEPECCVHSYIYISRLLSGKGNALRIRPGNWKKILIGTCLLASKFVDDISMKNSDFAAALTGWSLKRINRLEFNILQALSWKVYVPISEYTLGYFELVRPCSSTKCDWRVDFQKISPYFHVHPRAFDGLVFEMLEYHNSNAEIQNHN